MNYADYITTNNIHKKFPGIMEDGRFFSEHKQSSILNNDIKVNNNIKNNEQYRHFLVNNANFIMEKNKYYYMDQSYKYNPNNDPDYFLKYKNFNNNNNPYLFDNILDSAQPYGYETNQIKSKYLSQQQLASKTYNSYKTIN